MQQKEIKQEYGTKLFGCKNWCDYLIVGYIVIELCWLLVLVCWVGGLLALIENEKRVEVIVNYVFNLVDYIAYVS